MKVDREKEEETAREIQPYIPTDRQTDRQKRET